ncbi:MAG: S41 family peptidase [Chloroflexi bacterium]|nr:S41 family peptidase [Chloroflexota bacterium]
MGAVVAVIGILLISAGFLVALVLDPGGDETASTPAATATPAAASAGAQSTEVDFDVLDEILGILESDFVEPDRINDVQLYEGAINGLFNSLNDPHSTYIDPTTYAISRTDLSGTFQGIGATVSRQEDHIVIVRPFEGSPAQQSGVQPGDVILEVNGESAVGWTVDRAVLTIRGPRGTTVTLKVRHSDGTEEVIDIVRDRIEVDSISRVPPGGVLRDADGNEVTDLGYIRIAQFTERTPRELSDMIESIEEGGVQGLIIDVRGNPGGLLTETVEVTDLFLDEGVIIVQVDRDGNERIAEARPGQVTELPIVIVQDEQSASGSELLAVALQEHGRATIVGARSFGKGTVNSVRELSDGGAVYISIARYLSPDRNQIEGLGVTPDVPVELTPEDIEEQRDVFIHRAIDVLRGQIESAAGN